MLYGHPLHTLKPGDHVLVWRPPAASACSACSSRPLPAPMPSASSRTKRDYVMQLGAKGVINRKDFSCWGQMPTVGTPRIRRLGEGGAQVRYKIWDITGKRDVDIVFEHPGEATFPVSCLVVKRGGMVVSLRRDIGLQPHLRRALRGGCGRSAFRARTSPTLAGERGQPVRARPPHRSLHERGFAWDKIPHAHELMRTNRHPPGNTAASTTRRARDCARLTTWWRRVADRRDRAQLMA